MSSILNIHKSQILYLIVGLICWLAVTDHVCADNIRPVYLDIEEFDPGSLRVTWKVPLGQKFPSRFSPSFPESFKITTPKKRIRTSDAVIEKWTMICGDASLGGSTIGIEGLEETTTDALVRVQLADGLLHRAVLRPTETSLVIPATAPASGKKDGSVLALLRISSRWWYVLFFLAAWLLSLTPSARRRGITLCTIALIAGSVGGHALGGIIKQDNLFGSETLSETEARRVVRGLMLNTYRAFMLDNDEEVYDVLARSVDGKFLSDVYLKNREAMRFGDSEGTMSIVDRLDVKSIKSMKRLKGGAIAIVAEWDVYGSVRHWDHIHFRCNTYTAELTIVPTDNYWKMTRVQLLDEQRVI